MPSLSIPTLPRPFLWRRLHSLLGLWLAIFLIEHLFTNSQAALFLGEDGAGFIRAANVIKNLPYLPVIEITLLGVPILIHAGWGIRYLFTSKQNAFSRSSKSSSRSPRLPSRRNYNYLIQRVSSWILLIGIVAHIGYMRFYMHPTLFRAGTANYYFIRVSTDEGLPTLAERLGVHLFDQSQVKEIQENPLIIYEREPDLVKLPLNMSPLQEAQNYLQALDHTPLRHAQEVIARAPDFGTASLLVVRDAFKTISVSILYTIFVLAASFHAFNGLWTFVLSWGLVIRMRSQSRALNCCLGLIALIGCLGLASIWGTYFINLHH